MKAILYHCKRFVGCDASETISFTEIWIPSEGIAFNKANLNENELEIVKTDHMRMWDDFKLQISSDDFSENMARSLNLLKVFIKNNMMN